MILVTGGTGLVGAHLLLQLTQGDEPVRALYRRAETIKKTKHLFSHYNKQELFEKIEWTEGDILDVPSLEPALAGIDKVYHCAAYISFDPADEEKLRKINIEGTANMVNVSLALGIRKFCHVSSVAALGDLKFNEIIITEETEWNPEKFHSDYAISKHGAETEVWRGWQEGLEVVIVNPGLIFGYGFWNQGSGEIFKNIDKGLYFYSKGTCGAVAAEDVANIMIQLMESEVSGEQYTLVAENISFETIFNAIADGMHKKRPFIYATPFMTNVAYRLDWFFSKLLFRPRHFTRTMAKSAHRHQNFDNSKIKETLNYNFGDIKSHLKQIAKDFRSLS
ncbi:NAD-dependent epimerase/dehydratase family protein [Flavobacterium alkalisoli]|uniref:NAD-dependent epimerase/dehydratase family protein n=1 Tax=Flavobacterium alkalisoli TaxID=2602769 RepID=A0A5B9FQF7_9FLAO|nr:NAD-dependent epimerase/dehydratase family protein [Flavobacterium alkalisoli]QEE49065.1 NAD-dependent epimerase/dehydratase family protein [Flavobacterium alkalisoli]